MGYLQLPWHPTILFRVELGGLDLDSYLSRILVPGLTNLSSLEFWALDPPVIVSRVYMHGILEVSQSRILSSLLSHKHPNLRS